MASIASIASILAHDTARSPRSEFAYRRRYLDYIVNHSNSSKVIFNLRIIDDDIKEPGYEFTVCLYAEREAETDHYFVFDSKVHCGVVYDSDFNKYSWKRIYTDQKPFNPNAYPTLEYDIQKSQLKKMRRAEKIIFNIGYFYVDVPISEISRAFSNVCNIHYRILEEGANKLLFVVTDYPKGLLFQVDVTPYGDKEVV